MKQYLLSIYQPDADLPPREFLEKVMRDVNAVNQELKAADAWVFAGGLHAASTATMVRVRDGDLLMTDGPFAEGKEQASEGNVGLGGGLARGCLQFEHALIQRARLLRFGNPFEGESEVEVCAYVVGFQNSRPLQHRDRLTEIIVDVIKKTEQKLHVVRVRFE